jgi:hypothetical protein
VKLGACLILDGAEVAAMIQIFPTHLIGCFPVVWSRIACVSSLTATPTFAAILFFPIS